jgi:lipopolysaccharide/colanic/teichoic acid biosynthesis glycosyltransferase
MWIKRAVDISGATVLLIATSPILLLALVLVRITMGKPLIFRQERAGHNEQIFTLYKIRTMLSEVDASGSPIPIGRRLTPIGRMLRHLSIDELPQLWNVLRGNMSLVGPRPLLASYLPRYSDFQKLRHQMKPGITGYAQVAGRDALTWEEKFNLDVFYVLNWSLILDFRIVIRTVWTVLSAKNTAETGLPAEAEFMGVHSIQEPSARS